MKALAAAAAVLALLTGPALAAGKVENDPNIHVLHDYVLTMPKLKAYDAAYGALNGAARTDKGLQADIAKASSENDQTIAATIGKMDHFPRVYAFFQKQGLSKMEASLLPLILMDACTIAEYPQAQAQMATMVAPAQAAFCQANMPAIKGLHFFSGK
jgi:hypothetical protein